MGSLRVANTGFRKYHRIREENPLALFEASSVTENAVYGCVKPTKLDEVLCILKFALLVTVDWKIAQLIQVVNNNMYIFHLLRE